MFSSHLQESLSRQKLLMQKKDRIHEIISRKMLLFIPGTPKSCVWTKEQLIDVALRDVYVPTYQELNIRPCPNPPLKAEVYQETIRAIKKAKPG